MGIIDFQNDGDVMLGILEYDRGLTLVGKTARERRELWIRGVMNEVRRPGGTRRSLRSVVGLFMLKQREGGEKAF